MQTALMTARAGSHRTATGRWLVTGAGGLLGGQVVAELAGDDRTGGVTAASRTDLDITDPAAVRAAVAGHDVVVNTAAYTDADGAESDGATANAVNGHAVTLLAGACAEAGARLIHLSTDYVFGGGYDAARRAPYPEEHPTSPVNAYGRSKALGERAVLALLPEHGYVVRTAWLYGGQGRSFVSTMLRMAVERDTVNVVNDQWGQPTWSRLLARQLVELGLAATREQAPPGIYHGTSTGEATWYHLARAVFATAGHDPERVRPMNSDALDRPAPRPAYAVLGQRRWRLAGIAPQPDWRECLRMAFASGDLAPR